MGLFGGLFEKKICSICGNEIKLLGNRKLEDGNMCKECANKLSPWFSDRRSSTVEEIQEQLAYREENKNAVAHFNVTRTLGQATKVLLDEGSNKFIVTSSLKWKDQNPDVMDYSMVTGCNIDVQESKTELKQEDKEGKKISYNPPQYDYSYDIYMTIFVNHPYFSEMRFRVNSSTIRIENTMVRSQMHTTQRPLQGQSHGGNVTSALLNGVMNALNQPQSFIPNPENNVDYRECIEIANEIKSALTAVRNMVREEVVAASTPKQAVTCPWCGATTIPDENGCCEYCTGSLNG